MLSKSGEIRRDEGCFDYAGQFVMIYPCHGMKGNQEWVYGPVSSLLFLILPALINPFFLGQHFTAQKHQFMHHSLGGWSQGRNEGVHRH